MPVKLMQTNSMSKKPILAQLSSGDIVLNELNYHKSCCYKDSVNKYNQKKLIESNREISMQNEVKQFWKAVCFNKVIPHIREAYVGGIDFETSVLLKLYERLLEENNVTYSPHLTRFTDDVLNTVPELEKREVTKQNVKLKK